MTLQFTQAGSAWACEFEVTDKINLHIENAEGILLYQRTAAGKFALIKDAPTSTGPVFDYDLEGLVYPKHIRVICSSLPTYAEVVSDGEITEIKSQTKEVEVTANGTTQVAPDAGYSYLTGVTVKTNVPQSGGSGGGGEDAFYFIADSMIFMELGMFCRYIKNSKYIGYKPLGDMSGQTTIAGAIFPNDSMIVNMGDYNSKTVSEYLAQMVKSQGFDDWKEYLSTAPGFAEITEEEFYNLEGGDN